MTGDKVELFPRALGRRDWLVALLLGLAAALAFLPILKHGRVWDDTLVQKEIQKGKGVWGDYYEDGDTANPSGYFRPMFLISYKLDAHLYGWDNERMWHFTSLWLHALGIALFFLLMVRLGLHAWIAAPVALLQAWHPLHVENVAWISSRMDLMAALFWLASALALLASLRQRVWIAAAALFFALSLMSKEMAAGWPLLLGAALLLDRDEERRRGWLWNALACGAVLAAYLVARHVLVPHFQGHASWTGNGMASRIFFSAQLIGLWLVKMVWPGQPDPNPVFGPNTAFALGGWLIAAAVVILIARARHWRVHALFFLCTLLFVFPVSHIVPIGFLWGERFYFQASMPLLAWGGWMISNQLVPASRLRPAVMAAGAIVLVLCLVGMQPRLHMWRDSLSLWEAAGAANPGSALVHLNWGQALEEKGDERGAVEHYRRALELDSREYMALFNLARLTTRHGRHQEALELLHRIPQGAPAYPSAQKLATEVFIKLGNAAAALQSLEGGRESDPDVLFQKAGLLASQAQFDEAASLYQRVLGINPQMHAARLNLGKCRLEIGDYHAARRALSEIPESASEHLDALFTLGNVEAALGHVGAAVLAFEKVLEKDPGHAYALFNLVAIYEQTGQTDKADMLRPRLRDLDPPR